MRLCQDEAPDDISGYGLDIFRVDEVNKQPDLFLGDVW